MESHYEEQEEKMSIKEYVCKEVKKLLIAGKGKEWRKVIKKKWATIVRRQKGLK